MGNYKFKLSDMIPNVWFYKLKNSSRTRNQNITHPTKKKHQQTSSSSSSSSTVAPALPSKMQQPHLSHQRKSYHFARDKTAAPNQDTFYDNLATNLRALDSLYPEPPRKSSKKRRSTKRSTQSSKPSPRIVTSCVSAGCNCRATPESVCTKPDSTPDDYPNSPLDSSSEHESLLPQYGSDRGLIPETFDGMLSWSTSCNCRVDSNFVIDMENKPFNTKIDDPEKHIGFDAVSELDLPPITTKPSKFCDTGKDIKKKETNESTKIKRSSAKFEERNTYGSFSVKEDIVRTSSEEQKPINPVRKYSVHSPGVKLRTNSPRIASRRIQGRKSVSSGSSSSSRKDLSESFAVVKSSKDPQKDFKESMVEMIVENNIFASKDLEDLLACYLSLNSNEYHDLIINVFKQLWFDIIEPS